MSVAVEASWFHTTNYKIKLKYWFKKQASNYRLITGLNASGLHCFPVGKKATCISLPVDIRNITHLIYK